MGHKKSFGLSLALLLLFSLGISNSIEAYAQATASRLAGDWRASAPAALSAGKPLLSQATSDLGAAPSSTRLERMLLLLDPSADQQQALTAELASQQNPASPEYHHWLTPAAFASSYANSAADVAAVSAWLQSQGFQVAPLPASREWIEFSGTVAQVEQAFQTQIDLAATAAGTRAVLSGNISVPAAIKPLVHGLVSLDGALSTASLTTPQAMTSTAAQLAAQTSLSQAEALTPQLAAQLLHLDALFAAGTNGAGETIAVAGRSNVRSDDIVAFRAAFGLPASPLTVLANGADPGLTADQAEATLVASWAGAAAPGAQIVLAPAATTGATDGLDLSLAAIVDQALAHTVTVGYSTCEAALSEAHQAFYAALYQQAAAEGIAIVAGTGDNGPAACHLAGSDAPVTSGYGVNALASTPWNTAVGAAAFGPTGPASGASALAAWSPVSAADPAYAGGGGSSTLYGAPSWQNLQAKTAVTGTSHRLLPDLALPTALDSGVNHGLAFCLGGSSTGCTLVRSGGSSAAAALFAGLAALVAEKNGAQGNLAPNLYTLSRASGIFNDVQQGSAQLPCAEGSPDCGAAGKIGFAAAAGYDLATGLGTVNAQTLVNQWAKPEANGTGGVSVTLQVLPTELNSTYNPSAQITLTATVVSQTGGATPTGNVTFLNTSTGAAVSSSSSTLDSNGVATLTVEGVFALGGNEIVATYNGDANYASAATPTPVNINVQKSTTSLAVTPSANSASLGSTITATVTLTVGSPPAGAVLPAGAVGLNVDGQPTYTAKLATGTSGVTTATFSVVIPTSTLSTHTLQAVWPGDANYAGSTSLQIVITVTKGATVTTVTASPATLTVGMAETLTATIAPFGAATGTTYSITGTVSFYDGATLLGTGTVASNAATWTGTLTTNINHIITAVYSGDVNWVASTSAQLLLAATTLPDTVILTSNLATVPPGQAVILAATVTPNSLPAATIEPNPTGIVIFYNGATAIGTVALVPSVLSDASTATLTLQTLPGGSDTIVAVYQGDLYFNSGVSNPLNLNVQDFTITPSPSNAPTNLNIVQGASGSASFVITGLGGYNNQVQVVCAVPQQDDMTCTASPQQVTPTGTVTFVVQTFTSGGPSSATTLGQRNEPKWLRRAGGTALAVLGFFLLPFGRRTRIFANRGTRRFLTLLLLLIGLGSAGMGCNSSSVVVTPGTPLGVSMLTITATPYQDNAVVSHSVTLTVNVLAKGTTAP